MNRLRRFGSKVGIGRMVGLALLFVLLAVRIGDPDTVQTLRNQSFDLYQRIHPRQFIKQPVAIVDINEASLEKYGQWPWPRTRLADLVERVTQMGAAAIAFDILFSEPDRLSPGLIAQDNQALSEDIKTSLRALPSNDHQFADAISKSRIILGQTSVRNIGDERSDTRELIDIPHAFLGPDPRPHMLKFPDIVQNLPVIEEAAVGRGIFTVRPDPDGIFRRVPIVMVIRDKIRLSLSAELLRVATGGKAFAVRSDAAGVSGVILAGQLIKTDRTGTVWPYFSPGQSERFVSASDILDGTVPPQRLRGHLVLIGTSAVGLEDYRATPMGVLMPGVEIHAQVLESIFSKQLLYRPHYAISLELFTVSLLGIGLIILVPFLGAVWSFISATILLGGYAGASYYAFFQYRLLIDPTYPIITSVLLFMVLATANYLREEQQRKQIRGAFGQYISPDLVDQLADHPEKLLLGGETKELSVLFSDVRGFTAISESFKQNPQGLTVLMNHILTALSNGILRHHGTIDKFMGDSVMAFWNAPIDVKDHAVASCSAALEMIRDMDDLNAVALKEHELKRENEGEGDALFLAINVGIGINTGNCVVGNMGSENRFDYTALGDTVNIASRLEGQSKTYGVLVVLGKNTEEQVEGKFAMLELDLIRVKGKHEPEQIFGLFGDEEMLADQDFEAARAMNKSMIASYRSQDWSSAFSALDMLRDIEDRLNLGLDDYLFLYETRISEFRANPPGRNWDGVYTATSK